MEIFTRESWESYKKSVDDFNMEACKNLAPNEVCGYLREPNFVGYMDFVFQENSE